MKKKILFLLSVFLALPVTLLADGEWTLSQPDINAYYVEQVFQNGVYPDANYSGVNLYSICNLDRDECFGNGNTSIADSVAYLGYITPAEAGYYGTNYPAAGGPCKVIVRFDISQIPEEAIIDEARLEIRGAWYNDTYFPVLVNGESILIHRLLVDTGDWNNTITSPLDSVSWNNRFVIAAADSGGWWGTVELINGATYKGASDSLGRFGTLGGDITAPRSYFKATISKPNTWTSNTLYKKWANCFPTNVNTDSVSCAYYQDNVTTPNLSDITYAPELSITIDCTNHPSTCAIGSGEWFAFDIRKFVARWKSGAWYNYGLVIKTSDMYTTGGGVTLATQATTPATSRPRIIVRYYLPSLTAPSLGAGGRILGSSRGGLK